jgi:hypothetical protein
MMRVRSPLRRIIDPRSFDANLVFRKPAISRRPGRPDVMFMETACWFRDENGGSAEG